jgi:hypothetical protein
LSFRNFAYWKKLSLTFEIFLLGGKVNKDNDLVDAFISYQSVDEAFARKLAASIETYSFNERKLKVFFAPWDIKPGINIVTKIDEGLQKARFFIIILSPQALQADWPTAERAAAIYTDPSGRLGRVIPILRQSCRIPPLLGFRYYLDFRDDSNYETELTRLLCMLTDEPLPRGSTPLALYKESLQRKDVGGRSPLASLTESWKPDPVVEEICCNLFPVKTLPPKIWSAPCLVIGSISRFFEPEIIIPPHILKEKRLFTFVDLSKQGNIFSGVVENYDIRPIDVEEWFEDVDYSRWLVELLGWGLDKHCLKLGLHFDNVGKKYYYNKDVILKEVRWTPSKKRVPKELLLQYKNYFAHRAMQPKFEVIGNLIFLKINVGWAFTYDGYKLIQGPLRSTLSTKFLSRQKNRSNFNEIRFWAWLISQDGKTIKMDFGKSYVEIDAQPLSTSVIGGVFGDYTELSEATSGPPRIFAEEFDKESDASELQ